MGAMAQGGIDLGEPVRRLAWWGVNRWVQRSFPAVPSVSTQSLANWLGDRHRPAPVLLDVRRDYEFAVSHLPEARWTPNLEMAIALQLAPDQPIVAYCSVGYRSARLVSQLRAAGYTDVYNLTGSLFAWANDGRALVAQGQPVTVVHPFNRLWGLLLQPRLASFDPPWTL
jgi:rhodanese-related sulfurtransferase